MIYQRLGKKDDFPAWLLGIGDFLKRVVELRTKYPRIDDRLGGRNMANFSVRVLVRPDCSVDSLYRFLGEDFMISANCDVDFLASPFGFLASPAFLPLVTSTIQSVHQSQRHANKEWNGGGDFFVFILRRCNIRGE